MSLPSAFFSLGEELSVKPCRLLSTNPHLNLSYVGPSQYPYGMTEEEDFREKLLEDGFTASELEELLQNDGLERLLNLQGDEWRDWVDHLDWENLGDNNLVNLIFTSIDVESGVEQLDYFGVNGTMLGIVSHTNFSHENKIILSDLLLEVASDLDTYGDFFLDTCDDDSTSDWLKLYEVLAKNLDDEERRAEIKKARGRLKRFFTDNF